MTLKSVVADPAGKMSRSLRILFTISIFLAYMAFGFSASLTGPALLDIATLTHSTFDAVSMGLVLRTLAKGIGGVLIGWLYRHANRQIGVIVCLVGCALMLPLIPYNRTVDSYILSEGLFGFVSGGIDCASHSWIMELWPESGAVVQTLHFFFSLGMVIAPLVEAPFLSSVVPFSGLLIGNGTAVHEFVHESRIHIPYAIGSGLYLAAAVFAIWLRCYARYDAREAKSPESRETTSGGTHVIVSLDANPIMGFMVKGLALLLFFSYAISEMNLLSFISEYAVYSDLKLSKATGAFMASVLAASYSVFRAVSAIVAARVRTTVILYACVLMIASGNACLLFWGNTSVIGLWVAIVVLGAGHSSINASLYSFLRERMDMRSLICGCCIFSSCVGDMISVAVVSRLLESHPKVFGLVNIAGLSAVATLLAIFLCLDQCKKRQEKKEIRIASAPVITDLPPFIKELMAMSENTYLSDE